MRKVEYSWAFLLHLYRDHFLRSCFIQVKRRSGQKAQLPDAVPTHIRGMGYNT